MKKINQGIQLLLAVLMFLSLCATSAQAALLDMGPIVPRVNGSTPPTLGHGYPLWYRDTNRVPLELCIDEAMCLFLRPNVTQPITFPTNMPDEVFFFSADATMNVPGGTALLVSGVEGNTAINDDGSTSLISFARVRIRVDTSVAGDYVVTTPYKQYFFNGVPAGGKAINFTEDIGIGPEGDFAGALLGSIGPFLYSAGAPFVTATGSYVGDNTPRTVQGSTFIDPVTGQPANLFRVQGPGVNVSTTQFAVTGKIYTGDIPTPLTVDRVTYTRDASSVQVSSFATTQALSNQKVGGAAFPGRFALTNTPSLLHFVGTDVPEFDLATNSPADGKFYATSALFPTPASLPATVTVTNTADVPPTSKVVPLVDALDVTKALYTPLTNTLTVAAASLDKAAAPVLQVFMADETVLPDKKVLLGTMAAGQLSIAFPATISGKLYNIPPAEVTVTSALGGSITREVLVQSATPAPVAANDAAVILNEPLGSNIVINVLVNDSATAPATLNPASVVVVTAPAHATTSVNQADGAITYTLDPAFVGAGSDAFTYTVTDSSGVVSLPATVVVTIVSGNIPPAANNDTANGSTTGAFNIPVLANDTSATSTLNLDSIAIVTPPVGATATPLNNGTGNVSFSSSTPGVYIFQYTVNDNNTTPATSNVATVTVTVTAPVIPPTAVDDAASVTAGSSVVVNVVTNDTAGTNPINASSVVVAAAPVNGTAVANAGGAGTITYTPNAGYTGVDTFTYNVKDTLGNLSANATVNVTVNAPTTETITITRAQYTLSSREWRIDGNTTARVSGQTMKIFNSALVPVDTVSGILETVNVSPTGTFTWRVTGSTTPPTTQRRISFLSSLNPNNNKRESVTVTVR